MPFYEYECSSCKFYSEVMQKITDAPLRKCPSCGKNTMKKLVSAPNFRLKGSGWYETDFKSDQENKRNLAAEKETEPVKDAKDSKESKNTSSDTAQDSGEKKAATEGKAAPLKSAKSRGKAVSKRVAKTVPRKAKSKAAARRGRR